MPERINGYGTAREILVGDIVRLKKVHPCGGYDWQVIRLGADIGLKCLMCGRRVLMPRREYLHRVKECLSK